MHGICCVYSFVYVIFTVVDVCKFVFFNSLICCDIII